MRLAYAPRPHCKLVRGNPRRGTAGQWYLGASKADLSEPSQLALTAASRRQKRQPIIADGWCSCCSRERVITRRCAVFPGRRAMGVGPSGKPQSLATTQRQPRACSAAAGLIPPRQPAEIKPPRNSRCHPEFRRNRAADMFR